MDTKNKTLKLLVSEIFIKSWWVIAFTIICAIFFEQGLKKRDHDFQALREQLKHLQDEKKNAIKKQEDLQLQINSQSDPAWIELTLMKGLGLVPEGEKKVYFLSKP